MPADVELRLVANNQNAVRSVRELGQETQKVAVIEEQQNIKRKGFIQQEEARLKALRDLRDKTYNVDNLKFYNQEIERVGKNIKDLESKGIQTEKQTSNLVTSIGKMALAYLSVRTAVTILKETVLSFFTKSEEGFRLLEQKIAGFKASITVLQGEFIKLGKSMIGEGGDKSIPWGTRLVTGLRLIVTTGNLIPGVTKYFDDLEKRMNGAADAAEKYTSMAQEIRDAERALIVPRAKANEQIKAARLIYADETKTIKERMTALETAITLENKTADEEIKHQQWVILQLRAVNEEKKKAGVFRDEDDQKMQQAIAEEINLRGESYARQFRAVNSLKAIRKQAYEEELNQIETVKKMQDQFWDSLGEAMAKKEEAGKKQGETEWDWQLEVQRAIFKKRYKEAQDAWDKMTEGEKEQGKIDVENKKKNLENLQIALQSMASITQDIMAKAVENAQRTREILDQQISEAQQALETEVELYKAGYASNVAGKQKQIDDLKKLRAKALKDEEAAVKAQRQIDSITQTSALITSAANIFKGFSKMPIVGQILAIAAVGAMFAAFAAMKIKAANMTKLASGGHGEVKGRLHSEGGEPFLEHVEVEEGERWGVLSRTASRRYGRVFSRMVDDFNRNKIPVMKGAVNNIRLDTSMTNSRLERVERQLVKLNEFFEGQENIISSNGKSIIRKGNTTRIIKH